MLNNCDAVPMLVETVYDGSTSVLVSQHPYVVPCDVTTVASDNQAVIKQKLLSSICDLFSVNVHQLQIIYCLKSVF